MSTRLELIECPRDAMQGIHDFIPTDTKAEYINKLLKVGFHTIDFGSFVSPKAIPQMRDTAEVLRKLDLSDTKTKLLAIIANVRGAQDAVAFEEIDYLGYPLSLSETFQQRNTKRSIDTALQDLEEIQKLCQQHGKTLVTYLSMGFGNPYGDPYDASYIQKFIKRLQQLDVQIISLADTIGAATPELITEVFTQVLGEFQEVNFGAHLHAAPDDVVKKVGAAYEAGCRRIDSAVKGFGGCPMAKDDLVGNMATEKVLDYLRTQEVKTGIDAAAFQDALQFSNRVFL